LSTLAEATFGLDAVQRIATRRVRQHARPGGHAPDRMRERGSASAPCVTDTGERLEGNIG